jgi:predicted alpha/beta superfamily hydrolase
MIGDTWSVGNNFEAAISTNQSFVNSYPYFYTYSGTYTYLRDVYSPQLSNVRDLVIYLPPSYLENGYKSSYTTLVMHDGQNLFNASTSFGGLSWNCQSTLDGLITTGQMEEIIVVGVDNTPDRLNELTYSSDPKYGGGKGDIYLDFIRDTVLPLARSKFPIARDRSRLGILGSSLGGLISCYAGWTRTSEYGRAGCMSSSFWWNSEDFNNVILVKKPKPSQRETFYLDSGDSGDSQDDKVQTLSVMAHLQKLGYSLNQNLFYYLDKGGQHNEYFWGRRFWIPMTNLFPPALLTTEPL